MNRMLNNRVTRGANLGMAGLTFWNLRAGVAVAVSFGGVACISAPVWQVTQFMRSSRKCTSPGISSFFPRYSLPTRLPWQAVQVRVMGGVFPSRAR